MCTKNVRHASKMANLKWNFNASFKIIVAWGFLSVWLLQRYWNVFRMSWNRAKRASSGWHLLHDEKQLNWTDIVCDFEVHLLHAKGKCGCTFSCSSPHRLKSFLAIPVAEGFFVQWQQNVICHWIALLSFKSPACDMMGFDMKLFHKRQRNPFERQSRSSKYLQWGWYQIIQF